MADTSFDLIVVGGGPGGYVAAIRAAQLGLKTAVVERENMGGICLNWGCIPTKALLRTSEVFGLIKHADSFGISVKEFSYDAKKVVERSRKVANQLSNGVKMLMRKNKITVFDGDAKLTGSEGGQRKLAVAMKDKSNVALTAKNVILATGARARQLPGLESDGKLVWTYKEAMVPPEFPRSLLVIVSEPAVQLNRSGVVLAVRAPTVRAPPVRLKALVPLLLMVRVPETLCDPPDWLKRPTPALPTRSPALLPTS